ncbi:MAG: TRAP transporter small permease subunit [Pelagibacteraceae bacterium]|jgi:TRAP-type mannitol/chloroaromatic compound transport system permease small subunit|nr:TRAP transporter small permease subunit [Pelagibacteraceae bacterium]MBT6197332.1 TRAP transporter small permease subunit [Pelagibacteraceae bacterium]MBT6354401.1 TRAP transporter small permease subunit [Pelagibacteraceae bacterium]
MNISNFAKVFSLSIILIIFSFLINNYLTFGGNWPGASSVINSLNFYSIFQFSLYLFAIIFPIFFINFYYQELSLTKLADYLEITNGFIVRFAFWAVLIIGIIDAVISLLIIEGFIEHFFGKSWNVKFSNNSFRAPYIHFPLMFVAILLAFIFKSLNFYWLAFLVVLAEFQIVLLRFVFSYEQTLMSDLVRFWYGSLFLFGSYYTLIKDGHVRVDVLYTNFSEKNKARVNLFGSLILGIPLCLIIFFRGMACKQCVLNQPIMNFETSQSTQGMNIKYLMAGFLIIFAITMLIQFVVYFLRSLEIIKRK